MSEQEKRKGKLRIFNRKYEENIEDYFKRFYKEKEYNFREIEDTQELLDNFHDDFYREAIFYNKIIYEIIQDNILEDWDIYEATKNKNGTIDYVLSYYNGSCGFNEALEEALKNMKEE